MAKRTGTELIASDVYQRLRTKSGHLHERPAAGLGRAAPAIGPRIWRWQWDAAAGLKIVGRSIRPQ